MQPFFASNSCDDDSRKTLTAIDNEEFNYTFAHLTDTNYEIVHIPQIQRATLLMAAFPDISASVASAYNLKQGLSLLFAYLQKKNMRE